VLSRPRPNEAFGIAQGELTTLNSSGNSEWIIGHFDPLPIAAGEPPAVHSAGVTSIGCWMLRASAIKIANPGTCGIVGPGAAASSNAAAAQNLQDNVPDSAVSFY